MTLMVSIYDHCMDCMISYNCMALLWKPCFQVWPFYGNHVFKYDPFVEAMFSSMAPFMETMFSSMTLSWKSCFFEVWSFYGYHVFKYGPLMEIMFFEVWHFDETCSSVTILTKYKSYQDSSFFLEVAPFGRSST